MLRYPPKTVTVFYKEKHRSSWSAASTPPSS